MSLFEKYKDKFDTNPFRKGPQLSQMDLDYFESKFEVKLPSEFREFYSAFNGSYSLKSPVFDVDIKLHMVPDAGHNEVVVDNFLVLDPYLEGDGWYYQIRPKYYPGDPEERSISFDNPRAACWDPQKVNEYLTFADANGGTGYLLVGIVENNFGKIYLWDEDDDEIGNPHYIADSLFDIIENSYSY